jgi:hypothetical protein
MHAEESCERGIGPGQFLTCQSIGGGADRRAAICADESTGDAQLTDLMHAIRLKLPAFPEFGGAWNNPFLRPNMHPIAHGSFGVGQQIVDAIEVGQVRRSFDSS